MSRRGAPVYATSTIVVEGSLIADNNTNFTGASVASQCSGSLWASTVVPVNSTVRDNTVTGAGARGAGINALTVQVYGSTISGNSAIGDGAQGGGIFASSKAVLRQSTFSGNSAEGVGAEGGGIWAYVLDAMQITVADNQAAGDTSQGGGVYAPTVNRLVGGVLANNVATTASDLQSGFVDPTSTLPGVAYSLVRDPNGSALATGGGGVGNLLNVDALLGPLADNGGPTQTYLPLPGSPLIDAGDPTVTAVPFSYNPGFSPAINIAGVYDQRGTPYARVVDGGSGTPGIDMGAVEVQTPPSAGSFIGMVVSPSTPVTDAESPKSAAVAADTVLSEMQGDELLLLVDASPVVEQGTDAPDVGRSAWERSSVSADQIAFASFDIVSSGLDAHR